MKPILALLALLVGCAASAPSVDTVEIDYYSKQSLFDHISMIGKDRGFVVWPPSPILNTACNERGHPNGAVGFVPPSTLLCMTETSVTDTNAKEMCAARKLGLLRHDAKAHKVYCFGKSGQIGA